MRKDMPDMPGSIAERLAKDFSRLGWLGVWTQLVLAIIPVFMLCYVVFVKATGDQLTFDFTDYLAMVGLAILGFTTFWSYYYTRFARRIADVNNPPQRDSVSRALWVGIWASSLGVIVSLLLLFIETVRLLILFLKAPQAGVPVIQTQTDTRTDWVSAIDAVSLLAEVCTLTGELMVLGFSLWLLFRFTRMAGIQSNPVATAKG
jgi:hypothetical protein